ncbi:hypothetical protein KKI24_27700 [bacterium]|nr:hypothetical protein [bacterium]
MLADGIISDSAGAYVAIQKIHHWQGMTAALIVVAALTAIWKMKPTPFKVVAYARAGVLWTAIIMGSGFFFAEYWPAFSFLGEQVVNVFKAMAS